MSATTPSSSHDPPAHFALVHPLLYRSSGFTSANVPFVSSLRLRTCVSLGPELPSRAVQHWADSTGVRFVHLGAMRDIHRETNDWRPVQDELIKDALEFVLCKDNAPCLVMDQSGVYETGILIGCLRKLEGWTLSAVLAEYASIAGSKIRASHEQFIELFDTDLVNVPSRDLRVDWFFPPSET